MLLNDLSGVRGQLLFSEDAEGGGAIASGLLKDCWNPGRSLRQSAAASSAASMDYYAAMRCSLSLLFLLAWAPAWGAASLQTEHVSLSLESEQRTVTEGDTLWLGARFKILPHWHLYWKNPGDSGAPTLIRWHLPPGWRAGEIRWPVPRRIPVWSSG